MRFTTHIGLIALTCLLSFSSSRGETAIDSLFHMADQQVGHVSRKESIVAFEEIISKDKNYAPAYNELAKLHLLDYSVNGRQRARQIIQKAIERDYKNPAYQLTRAKIMWSQGFWEAALNQYKKVVNHHSKNTEALNGIGLALVYEYLAMRDAVKARDRDFSGFAAKANREAEQVLLKSIQLNPTNQTPYYFLGMLYFESQRFTDFQDLMRRLKMHYPIDKNVLLFCGLAEYEVGKFYSAHQFYSKALEQMSLGERELMESIDLLKPQEDPDIPVVQLSQDNISQSDELRSRNNFWKIQDPLYLSEFNERKMEHFGRLAYANLRFRRFSDDVEGWQTDMGKTWIKFGRFRYRKSSSMRSVETWFYEQFKIFFTGNGADRWSFGGGFEIAGKRLSPSRKASAFDDTNAVANVFRREPDRNRNIYPTRFEESSDRVFLNTEQRYVDPYLNRKYTLPYLIATFQERDSVRVELSYMIPKDRLKENPEDGKVSFWDGVFLFDEHWDEVYDYRKSVNLALPPPIPAENAAARHRNNHLLVSRLLYVPKGTYHFSVELLDQPSGAIGIARNEEQFLYDQEETFHLSDLLVASDIQAKNAFPEYRDDLIITPNPVRTFSQSELIFIYLELYDLQRDNFERTHYQISYTISKPEVDTVSPELFISQKVLDTLGKTEINRGQVHHTEAQDLKIERAQDSDVIRTVTANYEGNREDDFTYLQIDVNQVPAGIYQLTVLAKDKRTDQTDRKYVYFRVVE